MKVLFLAAFGAGLAFAVYSMLHGVERTKNGRVQQPAPHLNLPALAAFAISFGAVGYLLVRKTGLSAFVVLLITIASAVAAWLAFTLFMAKWALRPGDAHHLEAEEIQGRPAVVVDTVEANTVGTIRYERNGSSVEAPARSIDSLVLRAGSEVVIERFDGDVAVVEAWSSVEKRL